MASPSAVFAAHLAGVCSLGLYLVWCPKYRRRVLGGRVARRLGELLEQIATEHGWQIVANEVMPDHVPVRAGWTDRRARAGGAGIQGPHSAGPTPRVPAPARFAKVMWSPSYFAASVGSVSESTVRRYIEHEWEAVMVS